MSDEPQQQQPQQGQLPNDQEEPPPTTAAAAYTTNRNTPPPHDQDETDDSSQGRQSQQHTAAHAASSFLLAPQAPSERSTPSFVEGNKKRQNQTEQEEEKMEEDAQETVLRVGQVPSSCSSSTNTNSSTAPATTPSPTTTTSLSDTNHAVTTPTNEEPLVHHNPQQQQETTTTRAMTLQERQNSLRRTRKPKSTAPPSDHPVAVLRQQSSGTSWDMNSDHNDEHHGGADLFTDLPPKRSISKRLSQSFPQPSALSFRRNSNPSVASSSRTTNTNTGTGGMNNSSSNRRTPFRGGARRRLVHFSTVHVREYKVTIGDNPCCSYGPPLSLDWEYIDDGKDIPLDAYERPLQLAKMALRVGGGGGCGVRCSTLSRRSLVLNPTERRARLWRAGYSLEEIDSAAQELERQKWRQSVLGNLEPLYRLQEAWILYVKPMIWARAKRARQLDQQLERIERKVRLEHMSQCGSSVGGLSLGDLELMMDDDHDDADEKIQPILTVNGDVEQQQQQQRQDQKEQDREDHAVMIEGMANIIQQEKHLRHMMSSGTPSRNYDRSSSHSASNHNSNSNHNHRMEENDIIMDGKDIMEGNNELELHNDDGTNTTDSEATSLATYGIRVDKKQQDKACEIILCSTRRPHMRAFHASWFSFFMAFFSWFAITPLLGEVKDTLGLSKSEVWMSSLFGTAGTILMRIIMGPLCDVFGARICMCCILLASAIPTAMTGLVQTSVGLSLVRLFIGIGGASFVACQYWTSEMFTRETAGTANALVAGWG